MAIDNKLWLPPLSPKDQKRLTHLRSDGLLQRIYKRTGFAGKTLWDWLQLLGILAIPLVVAGATLGFGLWQGHLADVQHQTDQQGALDQQEATTLQTYMDNIQDLLLKHNLLKSRPTDDVAILARARTLTALQGLDSGRKGRLLIFLHEAELIGFDDISGKTHGPIINLSGADLSGADLIGADLIGAHLSHADLIGGYFTGAINFGRTTNLSGADLSKAYLIDADLSYAHLSGAHLSHAELTGADLSGADLSKADLSYAELSYAHLSKAHLNNASLSAADLGHADLSYADLNNAHLNNAHLFQANFSYADLSHADLSHADLDNTYLFHADLGRANNLTQQQLDQANTCKGAFLPQGLTCHHNL